MKKIILYFSIFSCILFTACETESTGDVSGITNFAVFTIVGDNVIFVKKGDTYIELGATADEAGVSVPVTTSSIGLFRSGELDTNVPDNYTLSYSAFNKDGYEASGNRNVIV
ncbi:MAG: DUF5011 domain-containing protein, partial [Oleispira sp.]|nr:DUF5011 domain-containing protein [Oleispira sp.]